jgi:hypothetical protein
MTRDQREHVLRVAGAIARTNSFVVVGSQAVLLPFPNAPAALVVSREVDLYPSMHPERADLIDRAIGALSSFDETFGYRADGVEPETAVMPSDWMQRASLHYSGDITAICPEIHDLAVSKAVVDRDKDADFIRILLAEKMITMETLRLRISSLDSAKYPVAHVRAWAQRRALEVQTPSP